MSKKKKVLIILTVSLIILFISFVMFLILNNIKEVKLDLNDVNSKILEQGEFNTSNMKDIDVEYITNTLGIDSNYVVEYIGKVPLLEISSSMYIVIQTNSKEEADIVLDKLNIFATNYENTWNSFLLSERKLVENRKLGKKGKYVYLIIDENVEELEKLI